MRLDHHPAQLDGPGSRIGVLLPLPKVSETRWHSLTHSLTHRDRALLFLARRFCPPGAFSKYYLGGGAVFLSLAAGSAVLVSASILTLTLSCCVALDGTSSLPTPLTPTLSSPTLSPRPLIPHPLTPRTPSRSKLWSATPRLQLVRIHRLPSCARVHAQTCSPHLTAVILMASPLATIKVTPRSPVSPATGARFDCTHSSCAQTVIQEKSTAALPLIPSIAVVCA